MTRLWQIRDVIQERSAEERQEKVIIVERQTQALMATVYAALGHRAAADAVYGWELFERADDAPPVEKANDLSQIQGAFGGAMAVTPDQLEAMVAELKAAR